MSATATNVRIDAHTITLDVNEVLDAARLGQWKAVLDRCRGDFLMHLGVRLPPEVDHWRDEVEALVRVHWAAALKCYVDEAERDGNWQDLAQYAASMLEGKYAEREVYARVVQVLKSLGQAHHAAAVLAHGAALYGNAWASEQSQIIATPRQAVNLQDPQEGRFIGRASEFAVLRACWEKAKVGRPSIVIVAGEAGIGKTRLTHQLLKLATIQSGLVLTTRCFEAGHRVSYGPLEPLFASLPPDVCTALSAQHQQLIGVLSGRAGGLVTQEGIPYREDAIIHACATAISLGAAVAPLVICVEDCQWIDAGTADLLIYLTARLQHTRLMILCVARTDGVTSDALTSLRNSASEAVLLGELSAAESKSLIESRAGARNRLLTSAQVERVVEQAGGNPFFLLELLTTGIERPCETNRLEIPASITKLLERKYCGLTSPARSLAAAAAVLDRQATPRALRMVSGLSRDALTSAVEELIKAGFVRDTWSTTVTLKHDLIRETVYGLLSAQTRRILHGRAAQAMKYRKAPPALVAYHASAAGLRQAAWRAGLAAGDYALQVSAPADAFHWYKTARTNAPGEAEALVACKRILDYAFSLGTPEQADPYLAELTAAFQADQDELGLMKCRHVRLVAEALENSRSAEEIASEMLSAAEVAKGLENAELAVRVFRDAATIMQHSATSDQLLAVVDLMLSAASCLPPGKRADAHAFAALAYSTAGSRTYALHLAEEAVDLARTAADALAKVTSHAARGSVKAANGFLAEGIADYGIALDAAEQNGVFLRKTVLEVNYAVLLMDVGRFVEAESVLRSARGVGVRENPFAVANLAGLMYETGRYDDALIHAAACAAFGGRLASAWLSAEAAALAGLIAISRGDTSGADTAYAGLRDHVEECVSMGTDPTHMVAFVVRFLARRGDAAAADDLIARALAAHSDRNIVVYSRLRLEHARMLVDRDPNLSYREAKDVASDAQRLGALPLRAQAHAFLEELELRDR